MGTLLQVIAGVVIIVVVLVFFASIAVWLLGAVALFMSLFALSWVAGLPIKVTIDGQTRTYKWFTRIR